MNNFVLFLLLSSSFLIGEEPSLSIVPKAAEKKDIEIVHPSVGELFVKEPAQLDAIEYKKWCPYGSFSLDSGAGVSWRTRNNFKGRAFDVKAGFCPVLDAKLVGVVALDYNWFTFYSPRENSLYLSWGLGGTFLFSEEKFTVLPLVSKKFAVLPLVPLRIGYQHKYGFIDAGAKMAFYIPLPELRAGMSFEF